MDLPNNCRHCLDREHQYKDYEIWKLIENFEPTMWNSQWPLFPNRVMGIETLVEIRLATKLASKQKRASPSYLLLPSDTEQAAVLLIRCCPVVSSGCSQALAAPWRNWPRGRWQMSTTFPHYFSLFGLFSGNCKQKIQWTMNMAGCNSSASRLSQMSCNHGFFCNIKI